MKTESNLNLREKLLTYAKNNLNVLFIGTHGIGKTQISLSVMNELGIKYKYYSSSTLDPFVDITGIPLPDKENNCINFYRPKDLQECEAILFDELNRAHPRVLNAVLEIIQFKTINGVKLPNLRFVWAAVNPPNTTENYQVEELDSALVDRFHCYIKMEASVDVPYLSTKFDSKLASILSDWWNNDLSSEQKRFLTPRRIECMGLLINANIPWRDSIPQGHPFPVNLLEEKLTQLNGKPKKTLIDFSKENIIKNKEEVLEMIKKNKSLSIKISEEFYLHFDISDLFEVRDILEIMPKDLISKISRSRINIAKLSFKQMFISHSIDYDASYPKISKIFEFDSLN